MFHLSQRRHAGSGQSLIMCECLSTLSKVRVNNNRGTGLLGVGVRATRESAMLLHVCLSSATTSRGIDKFVCFF